MKAARRVCLIGLLLSGAAVVAWLVTGREGYTRWPDERLERSDAAPVAGEEALLAEVGFTEDGAADGDGLAVADIRSRFAMGLVPGGFDPAHLLSVTTVVATSIAIATAALLVGRLRMVRPMASARLTSSRMETPR